MSTQVVKLLQKYPRRSVKKYFQGKLAKKVTVPVELQGSPPLYTIW